MNKKQTIILIIGASLIALRLIFPVMYIEVSDGLRRIEFPRGVFNFGPIDPCETKMDSMNVGAKGAYATCRPDRDRTSFQSLAIAIITGVLWFIGRKKSIIS